MSENNTKKVVLIILDGWGIAEPSNANAIYKAKTPTIGAIERDYFSTSLQASGIAVGLPWGREGNSEVGHMNLGAGRIIYQYLPRIVSAIRDGSFFKNKTLLQAASFVKRNKSTLHVMGLISSGTVHSYIDHLYGVLELAKKNGLEKIVIHVFTDGKDTAPTEGAKFIDKLASTLEEKALGKIGTIIGRNYAMDRNNEWDLTQKTYELLTRGAGEKITDPVQYLEKSYKAGKKDSDIEPAVIYDDENPVGLIGEGDGLIFINFREDRARQLTKAFILDDQKFDKFPRTRIPNLYFVGMTKYEEGLPMEVVFEPPVIDKFLAQVLSENKKTQLHIAETEKYAHITYFFNGEREEKSDGEERILIPSTGTPHYNNNPEMQTYNITQKLYENIDKYDFFFLNFANADMLAHAGDFKATIAGIEAIDTNLSGIREMIKGKNIALCITADHGNAEHAINLKTGEMATSHTANPVPFYLIDAQYPKTENTPLYQREPAGVLADVAPTILKIMGLPIPKEMTGKPLI